MPTLITELAVGLPPPPANFAHTAPPPQLRYQGAEALVYFTHFPFTPSSDPSTIESYSTPSLRPLPAFLKHRPRKTYRHPILDAKLTRHRILSEARVLAKLRREGVSVPALYAVDWEAGWMLGEWIDGDSARAVLDEVLPRWIAEAEIEGEDHDGKPKIGPEQPLANELGELMRRVGRAVGQMHEAGVVHGDLTTSNLLLRARRDSAAVAAETSPGVEVESHASKLQSDVVIIDFGLAMQSLQEEDRAVDLYVLERAFGSSHPRTERLFDELLEAYGQSYKKARTVLKRLEEVRLRGRKKIMIG